MPVFFYSLFASVRTDVQVRKVDRGEEYVFTGEDTVGRVRRRRGAVGLTYTIAPK